LTTTVAVLTQNILPIFIVAAFGFGLQRWVGLDKRSLSSAVLNVLSPCLVFSSLVNSELAGEELAALTAFALVSIFLMGLLGLAVSLLLRLSRAETAALLIVLMFVNGGNYGLTLNLLRYGNEGLARAVVYYTTSTFVIYTAGMFIASMGELTWRQSLRHLLRLPPVYAAVLAVVVYMLRLEMPTPLMRAIDVAGAGAIPVMLIVLGMQIADLRGIARWRLAVPAIGLRLVAGPLVGVLIAGLLGLEGLGRATSIIESSMPPAVFTIILATEFNLQPAAVTSIVVLSTLLSPLTVAAIITLFGL